MTKRMLFMGLLIYTLFLWWCTLPATGWRRAAATAITATTASAAAGVVLWRR